MTLTAHVAIGNSDDKLTQEDWSVFVTDLELVVMAVAACVHGSWDSPASSRWQNHCVAFDVAEGRADDLRAALRGLRAKYNQDSIALNISETELIS